MTRRQQKIKAAREARVAKLRPNPIRGFEMTECGPLLTYIGKPK